MLSSIHKARTVPLWAYTSCALALILAGLSMPGPTRAQATPDPAATPTADASDAGTDEEDGISYEEEDDDELRGRGGGGRNLVQVKNKTDGRLRIRGNIQLNRIRGERVQPENVAIAYNQACVDCQSIAVALQVNLISRSASYVAPQNLAVALNEGDEQQRCVRCTAVARAIQYVYSVDDSTEVPEDARALIWELDRELRRIHSDRDVKLPEAEARVNAVIARFRTVAQLILEYRDEKVTPEDDQPDVTPAGAPSLAPAELQPASAPTAPAPAESEAAPAAAPMPTVTPLASPTPIATPGP